MAINLAIKISGAVFCGILQKMNFTVFPMLTEDEENGKMYKKPILATGGQGVAGSNPVIPTSERVVKTLQKQLESTDSSCFFITQIVSNYLYNLVLPICS